ncbi:MAG TPA: hypothetical protein VKV77_09465 [Methylovirgula sp.]|nr:hypothetical protein [Methylovirgula sp.]
MFYAFDEEGLMFHFIWRPALACAGIALLAGLAATQAQAESVQKQCSEKYQAAKAANSLNGQTWNQFYHQCAADLKGGAPASNTAAPASNTAAPSSPPPSTTTQASPPPSTGGGWFHHKKKQEATAPAETPPAQTPSAAAPEPTGPVVFPPAISSKYSNETPAKQRFHTCLDQYHANKATNSNGGLKWIEKGGGYYSECNKKLKGA